MAGADAEGGAGVGAAVKNYGHNTMSPSRSGGSMFGRAGNNKCM